jgi:hypothetical protein
MNRWHLVLVLATLAAVSADAHAGILFKKTKPIPTERVPELIGIVQTEKDEHKRVSAAVELRQYDANTYPEIIVVLADVLLTDPSSSVRAEAADSLARLRPVTQSAGLALEQALAKDNSMKVRMQARYALLQYHWAGYHSTSKDAPLIQSKEPPLAKEGKPAVQMPLKPQQTGVKFGDTPPPPPAPPADSPAIQNKLPKGPVQAPLVPTDSPAPPADSPAIQNKLPKGPQAPLVPTDSPAPPADSPAVPNKLPKGPVQAPLVPTDPPVLKAPPLTPSTPPAPEPKGDQGPDLTPPE